MQPAVLESDVAQATALEANLWRLWRENGDAHARALLMDLHLPYARKVASIYYSRRFNDEIEFADYEQLAALGLIESMERFDPGMGVAFRTFASRRMHGSIVDGIEHATEKQQQIAARARLEANRRESIARMDADEDARAPTKAARTTEQVLQYVAEAGLAFALSWVLDGTGMLNAGETAVGAPFYRSVELRDLRSRAIDMLRCLTPRESAVIRSHYFHEMPFEDIAAQLGISKGRVSQLHKRALERLREGLRADDTCDLST